MKFIDEFDIELVNQNLSFDTVDSHIHGTIDLFTTKPIGSDKKLYKTIDKNWDLYLQEHHQQALQQQQLQEPILSPPVDIKQRSYSTSTIKNRPALTSSDSSGKHDGSQVISRSFHSNGYISPSSLTDADTCVFGPLHQQTSRRTFAYLIGILNTCYPDHDFSSLNPDFFKSISSSSILVGNVNNLLISLGKSEQDVNWIWDIINSHMDLQECICFELDNDFLKQEILNNPSVLWCNFFFLYNKKRKRVAFIQLKSIFLQARRSSLLALSREALNSSDNEYDLTNDVDEDAIMDEDDEDELDDAIEEDDEAEDVVGGLEF